MKNTIIENDYHEIELWEHSKGMTIELYDTINDRFIVQLLSFDEITKMRNFMTDILNEE